MAASSVCSSDGVLNARQSALTILNTRCNRKRKTRALSIWSQTRPQALAERGSPAWVFGDDPAEGALSQSLGETASRTTRHNGWMIAGCLEWQRIGLAPPAVVTDATSAYLEAEDAMGSWIDDSCERDAQSWEQASTLFASWSSWATKAGEQIGSQKAFSEKLQARGLEPQRRRDGRGFVGLRLRPAY